MTSNWCCLESMLGLSAETSICSISMWPMLPCNMWRNSKGKWLQREKQNWKFLWSNNGSHVIICAILLVGTVRPTQVQREGEKTPFPNGRAVEFWKNTQNQKYCCGHFWKTSSVVVNLLFTIYPHMQNILIPSPTAPIPSPQVFSHCEGKTGLLRG